MTSRSVPKCLACFCGIRRSQHELGDGGSPLRLTADGNIDTIKPGGPHAMEGFCSFCSSTQASITIVCDRCSARLEAIHSFFVFDSPPRSLISLPRTISPCGPWLVSLSCSQGKVPIYSSLNSLEGSTPLT